MQHNAVATLGILSTEQDAPLRCVTIDCEITDRPKPSMIFGEISKDHLRNMFEQDPKVDRCDRSTRIVLLDPTLTNLDSLTLLEMLSHLYVCGPLHLKIIESCVDVCLMINIIEGREDLQV